MLYLHLYIILLTYLGKNQLTGSVPTSVGQLIHLMVLSFWENQINGSIPEKLGNLKNLTGLDLSENFISGRIPSQFQYTLRVDFLISTRHKWFLMMSFSTGTGLEHAGIVGPVRWLWTLDSSAKTRNKEDRWGLVRCLSDA